MCVTSTLTCPTCLAKWTGEFWQETYQGVLPLKTWTLVLNKRFQLCIEGHYDDLGVDLAVCIPIKKRVNSRWVASEHTLIKLHGPLFSKDLPEFIVSRFCDGIPNNWKVIVDKWIEYVGQGEDLSFSWNLNDTVTSDVSSRTSRNRRNITAVAEGKGRQGGRRPLTAPKQSSDSAIQSAHSTIRVVSSDVSHTDWASPSPWLPAHKVKEITQWMNRSPVSAHIPPVPHGGSMGLDSEAGDGGSAFDVCLDGLPSGGARTTPEGLAEASQTKNLSGEIGRRKNNSFFQSTPLGGVHDIRPSANPLNISLTMSTISSMDISSATPSFNGVESPLGDGVFRKPMADAHGVQTALTKRNEPKTLRNSAKAASKAVTPAIETQQPNNIQEVSSKESPRTDNCLQETSSRPRRRHNAQKIERWRPILGVDGNLKLQGYLLLRGDMTAGQILTTNTVVKWLGTSAVTQDNRQYELLGDMHDPSGKIPPSLKKKLLKSINCQNIVSELQEIQALKDRSDWGAEYEIFYNDSNVPDSSSPLGRPRKAASARLASPIHKRLRVRPRQPSPPPAAAPPPAASPPTDPASPAAGRRRRSPRLSSGAAPSRRDHDRRPTRRSATRANNSNNTRNSNERSKDNALIATQNTATGSSLLKKLEMDESSKNSTQNTTQLPSRRCFENITWKSPQNRVNGSSVTKKSDTPIIHISPSRIKVSYLTKSKPDSASKTVSASASSLSTEKSNSMENTVSGRTHKVQNGIASTVDSPRTRVSRCPAKLSEYETSHIPVKGLSSPHITPKSSKKSQKKSVSKSSESCPSSSSGSPKKCSSNELAVERNLRSTLGKTRRQTKLKSPRLLITPLEKKFPRFRKGSPPGKQRVLIKKLESPRAKKKSVPQRRNLTSKAKVADNNERKRSNVKMEKRTKVKPVSNKTKKVVKMVAKRKRLVYSSFEESDSSDSHEQREKGDETASVGSNSTDMSVGPSASVIFALSAAAAGREGEEGAEGAEGRRRAPRTLKERRQRDAALESLRRLTQRNRHRHHHHAAAAATATATATADDDPDDDPVAALVNAGHFADVPQEWCDHRAWLRQNRKRRRPSSSEGTVSPSRSALSDFHEDATSSVATPQLLMRRPDPKQVQSYLQRLKAMNSKSHRPSRKVKADRQLALPDIDYTKPFQKDSSSESGSEQSSDEWEDT